jgi:hypothetical protein
MNFIIFNFDISHRVFIMLCEANEDSVPLTQYCPGGKMEKNEMGRAWGRGEVFPLFGGEA